MIVESGIRASTLAATTLTSSFLPKCTQILQINVAPLPPTKTTFHGVRASTKQKKKNRKSSSPTRGWAYEHFMVLWDEVFEHCCTDPVKATQIRNLSCKGLLKHGRGCVLVFQEVQTLPRGPGTGFTSKPPKTSRRVPDFFTTEYYAVYLPKEFLLDPRKAPLEEDLSGSDDKEQPLDNAGKVVVERQGDDTKEIIDVTERAHGDLMMGTCEGGGTVIDIDEIVRDAQDVYTFYSDDEDELDGATDGEDESLVGLDDKEGNTNRTDSLLILDDEKEGSSNTNDSLIILDDAIDKGTIVDLEGKDGDSNLNRNRGYEEHNADNDNHTNRLNDSERCANQESHLVVFDDVDEAKPHLVDSVSRDTHHEEVLSANRDPIVVEDSTQPECNRSDNLLSTQMINKEEHSGDGNFKTSRSRKLMPFDNTASISKSVSDVKEIDVFTASLLKEGSRTTKTQVESYDGTHAEFDELGSAGTAASTVELLDESPKAETSESSGLMEYEKGSQYEFNDQGENEEVPLVTQQMLYTCMRGMDRTRLMSLTANFDFEADRFRFARKMAVIDLKTSDAGGEEPYNPKEEELVLLLYLSVDGKPAYGADVVVAYRDECETVGVEKDSWKLRGKYKNIFA